MSILMLRVELTMTINMFSKIQKQNLIACVPMQVLMRGRQDIGTSHLIQNAKYKYKEMQNSNKKNIIKILALLKPTRHLCPAVFFHRGCFHHLLVLRALQALHALLILIDSFLWLYFSVFLLSGFLGSDLVPATFSYVPGILWLRFWNFEFLCALCHI